MELTSYAVVFTLLHSANKLKLRNFYLKSMIASETGARTVGTGGGEPDICSSCSPPVQTQTLRVCFVCACIYIYNMIATTVSFLLSPAKFTLEDIIP